MRKLKFAGTKEYIDPKFKSTLIMILGTLNKMKDRQALMIENKITFSYVRSSRAILRLNDVASVSTILN